MAEQGNAPGARTPTVAEVDRIAALRDPVVRNLQITQCYFELSAALRQAVGPGANWCTFATWASKQAGQTIRKEDLARTLEAKLKYGPAAAPLPSSAMGGEPAPAQALPADIWQVLDPTAPFTRASEAVARGNLKVFAEIAREVARFLADCLTASTHDMQALENFCAALRPGDPPTGQHYLHRAFTHYFLARAETDATRRAQWMLLANLEIGFHEQTRLQPEIVAAMEAPVIDPRVVRDRIAALLPAGLGVSRLRRVWARLRGRPSPLDQTVDWLVAEMREETRFLISDQLMAIELPQATRLRLGRDLRAPYPSSLQQITTLELRELLADIDPMPASPQASGAADWGNLCDRLHFIVELFRCYQEWPPLFDAPFSPAQLQTIQAGRKPTGRL